MITKELINPRSLVVVGASNDLGKPGGKILKNILDGNFKGTLYASNPKENLVQGIKSYRDLNTIPQVDLAILAIASKYCPDVVRKLAYEKETRAFIIISAGFSEENEEGARLEKEIVEILEDTGSCMIGPNCIGVINTSYNGCFTTPIPKLDPKGVDFISASGATAVYVMEASIPNGLTYSSVYSVGNSAQAGVEDVLEYLDVSFDPDTSSRVKLLYFEDIKKPQKLLKHASSLRDKGCKIAAIKAGRSEAGSRAASSHTGALANSDLAVDALFRKAGIVRCDSRQELAAMGGIFLHKELKGKNIAIITHAGGPAVMLTDVLSENGFNVPSLDGPVADELLELLHPGSSASNPIDILATGSVQELEACIDFVGNRFDEIDGMVVIFGSPGMFSVEPVYDLLSRKMDECTKPIYPILPSLINARDELTKFLDKGRINFPEEVVFGSSLAKSVIPAGDKESSMELQIDTSTIRRIVKNSEEGYLTPGDVQGLLDAVGIDRVREDVIKNVRELEASLDYFSFPVVMKAVGPVHKTDVGGVVLGVRNREEATDVFERLMKIEDANSVMIQSQISGEELFAGAKSEGDFGRLVLFGMGGIFIEVFQDVVSGLAPMGNSEIDRLLKTLKSYKLLEGVRGAKGIDIPAYKNIILRLSALVDLAPEIEEMDLNPILAGPDYATVVDARIRIKS